MDGVQTEQLITEQSFLSRKTRRQFFTAFVPKSPPPYKEFQTQNPNLLPSERIKRYREIGRINFLLKAVYGTSGLVGIGFLAKLDLPAQVIDTILSL